MKVVHLYIHTCVKYMYEVDYQATIAIATGYYFWMCEITGSTVSL